MQSADRVRGRSGPREREEVGVELRAGRRGQSVCAALVDLEFGAIDQLGGAQRGSFDRDDLIIIAVNNPPAVSGP